MKKDAVNSVKMTTKSADKATRRLVKDITLAVVSQMNSRVAIIPQATCRCGKSIEFTNNRKTYTCSRCGNKWELSVVINKISNF